MARTKRPPTRTVPTNQNPLYSSPRPSHITQFSLRPILSSHIHLPGTKAPPPPMMFREVVSEFKEALEGLVNLEKKGSGAEEGMQVAIRLLLGWTEQLRLEWAFMKGAQAASTGVAEGGDETQEGGGSCSCSKTKKRKGNRVEKDKVLIDLTSSGGPEDAEEQDDDDEKGGRRDDEEEYEMEHDDDIFGDRSSNEDEDRETIPPDDYDYEWEINASRARKRQRRSKAPGAELPDPDDEEAEYEVDTILDSGRLDNGEIRYLVHWKSYPDSANTWEPVEHLVGSYDLISAFHDAHPEKPGPNHLPTPAPSKKLKRKHSSGSTSGKIPISDAYHSALGNYLPTSFAEFKKGLTDAELKKEGLQVRTESVAKFNWDVGKWKAFAVARKGGKVSEEESCSRCRAHRGKFEGCLRWGGGKCANCLWARSGCA